MSTKTKTTKPYCGSKTVPVGRKKGTMKECSTQIRLYGLNKIDSATLKQVRSEESDVVKLKKVSKKLIEANTKLKKLDAQFKKLKGNKTKEQLSDETNKKLSEIAKEARELRVEIPKLANQANELNRKINK